MKPEAQVRTTGTLPLEQQASLQVERVSDADALRELRPEWDELLQSSASRSLCLTWEWLHTWWTHLAGPRRLFVLTVRSGGQLVAIAPFALRTRWAASVIPVRALEFLGSDRLSSDYLDLIIRRGWEEQAVEAFADYLVARPFLVEMANVDKASRLATALARALAHRGWSVSEQKVDVCPFVRLSGQTWESYVPTLKSRGDFRRLLRNMTRQFTLDLEVARSESQRRDFMRVLVEIHNRRWQDLGGSDAFNSPDLLAFHDEVTRLALDRGWLRLFVLSLDGRPVAALYGVRYHTAFLYLQLGFDPAYARQSVGHLIIGLAIKSAFEEGAQEFDCLRGGEPYKFRWAEAVRELTTLTACPGRVRERLYRRAEATSVAAKRTVRSLLPRPLLEWVATYRQRGFRG